MREGLHGRPRRFGARWAAAAVGLGVGAATVLALSPASSADSATVTAQLSLSGVATQGNILGGTTVGIHPGDSIDFKASALPTAGLDNIPALGPVLHQVLDTLLGSQFQVVAHFPATFPGGAQDVTLGGPTSGPCKGVQKLPVTFANIGSYTFTWKVQYVLPGLLGGCTASSLNNANLNLLKSAGVALNATNQWVGQIVVATNPPPAGISIQLPGLSIAPSLPVLGQLPSLGVPAINIPTLPVNIPSLVPTLPGKGSGGSGGGDGQSGNCVPCSVVPSPGNFPGGGFGNPGVDSTDITQLGAGLHEPSTGGLGLPVVTATASAPGTTTSTKRIDLASNKAPAAETPVALAIIAVLALVLVTAMYGRLYLLRRS